MNEKEAAYCWFAGMVFYTFISVATVLNVCDRFGIHAEYDGLVCIGYAVVWIAVAIWWAITLKNIVENDQIMWYWGFE